MQALPSVLRRYGLAAVLVVFGLLLTKLLPLMSNVGMFVLPLAAIALSARYGGRQAGLLATGCLILAIDYLFMPPEYSLSISPLKNGVGLIVFTVVALFMVELGTARRRDERRLRESNERLNLAQEAAGAGVWEWNIQTGAMNWSEQYYRLLGLKPEECQPSYENWFRFIHPEDQVKVRAAVDEARKGKRPLAVEYRIAGADHNTRWLIRRGRRLDDDLGQPVRMLGITLDITTRKQAEEVQRESEGRWRAVFENSVVGIALTDLEGRFLITNSAYQRIVGYTAAELQRLVFLDILHEQDREAGRVRIAEVINGRLPQVQMEQRCRLRNGRVSWVAINASLVPGTQNTPPCFLAIVDDITERKQAQAGLLQLSGRLLHLQDDERRHLARQLHDSTAQELTALFLKLAVVKKEESSLSREGRKALVECDALARSAHRGIRTMSYLLHPPLLDTAGLEAALGWYVDGFIQRSGIAVHLLMPSEFPRLPTEVETTVFRIVQEGLTNVLNHSGSRTADVRVAFEDGKVVLEVHDQGCGMPKNLLGVAADNVSGLGIGIMGMRERVRQLNGHLDIASGDSGTTVRAILPISERLSRTDKDEMERTRAEYAD